MGFLDSRQVLSVRLRKKRTQQKTPKRFFLDHSNILPVAVRAMVDYPCPCASRDTSRKMEQLRIVQVSLHYR